MNFFDPGFFYLENFDYIYTINKKNIHTMQKLFDTPKSLNEANTLLDNQIQGLTEAMIIGLTKDQQEALSLIREEKQSIKNHINSTKQWNFNFRSGGWNSVIAVTKQEAIETAISKYSDSDNLDIDEKTFRVATDSDTKALLSLFY